jgi:hypothetical protein
LYRKLTDNALQTPDTWEVALSGGADKKESFARLMAEGKLGALAFLRNLRNMAEAGVEKSVVSEYAGKVKTDRVLPFRFIAAARAVPQWEDMLEPLMLKCLEAQEKIKGKTVLLVDVSGSMNDRISGKSDLKRLDAACGLGILLREVCEEALIFTFSENLAGIPPRRGFALSDAIIRSQPHGGTYLGGAVKALQVSYDRLIIITDEQSADLVPNPSGKGYIINVASNKNGVGYGPYLHINGWSESCIDYIRAYES